MGVAPQRKKQQRGNGLARGGTPMNSVIYLVGLVVVVLAVLTFFGLR
jgi:hypothetical protein